MVVMKKKPTSAPSSPNPSPPSADPLRGVQHKQKETEVEFGRLKNLVPTISKKQSVSQLDVILEAIRYIDQLQDQLFDRLEANGNNVNAFVVQGKENAVKLQDLRRKRRRSE